MRSSSRRMSSIWRSACRRCWSFISARPSAIRRPARRRIADAVSSSRASAAACVVAGASVCRCVFRNSSGCARIRSRTACEPSRQARYSCAACRASQRCSTNAAAIRSQSSTLRRATGTRYFIAVWAAIFPSRTCCWMASGTSSTSASRRDAQLMLRSKRRASSSSEKPKCCAISDNSQPCSSAHSCRLKRSDLSSSSASASLIGHTMASTVSWRNCSSAARRL